MSINEFEYMGKTMRRFYRIDHINYYFYFKIPYREIFYDDLIRAGFSEMKLYYGFASRFIMVIPYINPPIWAYEYEILRPYYKRFINIEIGQSSVGFYFPDYTIFAAFNVNNDGQGVINSKMFVTLTLNHHNILKAMEYVKPSHIRDDISSALNSQVTEISNIFH